MNKKLIEPHFYDSSVTATHAFLILLEINTSSNKLSAMEITQNVKLEACVTFKLMLHNQIKSYVI